MKESSAKDSVEHREVPLASYPEQRPFEALTESALALILASRQTLIAHGGHYGDKLAAGGYLDDLHSVWQVIAVAGLDNNIATVVLWKEVDDGRFSFHFAAGESEPRFFCYEN